MTFVFSGDQFMPFREDELAGIIRSRRTVNDFRPELPPEEDVLEAIELARWAPNHKLTQPWRFHLIGPETSAAIVDLNSSLIEAAKGPEAAEKKRRRWAGVPGWLAVSCRRSPDPLRAREDYAACCCAVQILMLALWSRGIGTKWSTGDVTRHVEFARLLHLDPAEREVVGLFWYGYPADIPAMRRLEVAEILERLP